jgi:hypothetical protein
MSEGVFSHEWEGTRIEILERVMKQKRVWMIIVGGLILVAVLAAGAFTAVRLLATPDEAAATSGGGRVIQSVDVQDGGVPVSVQTTILPAPELPDEPTAASGIFVRREDNTIVIGTGNIDVEVDVEVNPETGQETTTLIPSSDGPEIEVVITHDTMVYLDVTDFSIDGPIESGEREIVQAVRPVATAGEIGENTELQVWGERSGDRVIATIVVYGPLGGGAFD